MKLCDIALSQAHILLRQARENNESPKRWLTPVDEGLTELMGIPVEYDRSLLVLTLEVEHV